MVNYTSVHIASVYKGIYHIHNTHLKKNCFSFIYVCLFEIYCVISKNYCENVDMHFTQPHNKIIFAKTTQNRYHICLSNENVICRMCLIVEV